jgi:hypothetical protein
VPGYALSLTTPAVSRVVLGLFFLARARLRSSTQCCPPNISSITIDYDELFELIRTPSCAREAGSLINRPVTFRTIARFWHPRTGFTALLLLLSTTTELVVLKLIPQHDPQPDPELASHGHARLPETFLD